MIEVAGTVLVAVTTIYKVIGGLIFGAILLAPLGWLIRYAALKMLNSEAAEKRERDVIGAALGSFETPPQFLIDAYSNQRKEQEAARRHKVKLRRSR